MTAVARPSTGRPSTRRATSRPKLKVLDQRAIRQRARRRHALLALFIVVLIGFFAVAFVHAELVADQQELDSIRTRIAEAEAYNAKIEKAAEEASSPQIIVSRAEELGMVRAYEPVYLAAVVPVRDMPTSILFNRTTEQAPFGGVASPPVAGGPGISVGISSSAPVTPAVETTEPIIVAGPVQTAATETATQAITESTSLGGSSVSASGAAAPTAKPTQAPAVESDSSINGTQTQTQAQPPAVTGSSFGGASVAEVSSGIAGSRAVTAGSGNGEATSRFGGLNVGAGSG